MTRFSLTAVATCASIIMASQPLAAQERGLSFGLSGGVGVAPSYFGASDLRLGPTGRFGFAGLGLGPVRIGSLDSTAYDGPLDLLPGAGLRGAFRYIAKREGRDELAGLDDVKAAVELGFGVHYTEEFWQVFADLRYGVIGHRGFAGEIGANAIYRSGDGLVLHAGPRAEFGNRRFAQAISASRQPNRLPLAWPPTRQVPGFILSGSKSEHFRHCRMTGASAVVCGLTVCTAKPQARPSCNRANAIN